MRPSKKRRSLKDRRVAAQLYRFPSYQIKTIAI